MISKAVFLKLKQDQKERVLAALFEAKFKSFSILKESVVIDVPAGYSVRVAAVLQCEEQDEIVKRIFVVMEEFNDFLTTKDINEIYTHVDELAKTGEFVPERDDFWVVTNEKWTYEAYEYARGKVALMDADAVIEGIEKYYDKSRELRDAVRHFGLVKE
ncbi:MAG: hypothetical protein ABIG20_04595 [archaeon]